jgi:hypothetical protein
MTRSIFKALALTKGQAVAEYFRRSRSKENAACWRERWRRRGREKNGSSFICNLPLSEQ